MNLNAPLTIAPETKQKWRRRFKYGGIILISLFAINLLIIEPIRIHRERQQFEKAAVQLESIATQIQAKIGKADDKKVVKSCGYASREFGRGPLGCGVSVNLLYSNRDSNMANQLMTASASVSPAKLNTYSKRTAFVPRYNDAIDQSFDQGLYLEKNPFTCSIQYIYPVLNIPDGIFKTTAPENLEISLGCGGAAMAERYTVTKP